MGWLPNFFNRGVLARLGIYEDWLTIDGEPMEGEEGTGSPGPKGDKGDKGDTGEQGPIGLTGPKGDAGHTGEVGPKGDTGPTGPKGDQGIQGVKGDTGSAGAAGATGATGLQGIQGVAGPTGLKGDTGATGAKGDTGLQGIQGLTGATGSTGPSGSVVMPYRKRLQTSATGTLTITFPTPFAAIPAVTIVVENPGDSFTYNPEITAISASAVTMRVMRVTQQTFTLLGLTAIQVTTAPTAAVYVHVHAADQS